MEREHRVSKRLVFLGAAGSLAVAFAGEVVVTDQYKIDATENTSVVLATRTQAAGYPADVPGPVFWFDATQTNGWEIAAEDGRLKVKRIPSLVGTRYLAVDGGDNGHWHGWNGGAVKNFAPSFVSGLDGTLPGVAVDFGATGSRFGLCFDPVDGRNALKDVGSIVVVYDSSSDGKMGGGFLMGGGVTGNFEWHRGYDDTSTWYGNWYFSNPILLEGNSKEHAYNGQIRHDGLPTWPMWTGFNHGWEVLTFIGREAADLGMVGPGLGDTRNDMYHCSGGMKMGELLVFDRLLTAEEATKLEVYLERKWFNRDVRGWNGDAYLGSLRAEAGGGNAQVATVDVPAGAKLSLGRLNGGRLGGTFVKTGEGALTLGRAADFGGTVKLAGGKLDCGLRAIPTEFPHDLYLHFDVSDAETLTTFTGEDGKEYVSMLRDTAGGTIKGKRVVARSSGDTRPELMRDVFGPGLHAINFGKLQMYGAKLTLTTNDVLTADYGYGMTARYTPTVIQVWGLHRGGGHFADHAMFQRGDDPYLYTMPAMKKDRTGAGLYQTNGVVYVDGVRSDPTKGFPDASYHVVAYSVPYGSFRHFCAGSDDGIYCGGGRMSEALIYNRVLTEQEILDVSAMLEWKWFGRVAPGYRRPEAPKTPQVQSLEVTAASELEVADGDTVRVGTLSVAAPLAKTGAGTLEVERLLAGRPIDIAAGAVRLVDPPEPAAGDQPADDPAMHLDATKADTMLMYDYGEGKRVQVWEDVRRRNTAWADGDVRRPDYLPNALNGLPVLDFRKGGDPSGSPSGFMYLNRDIDSARSIFLVMGTQNDRNGYYFLGSCSQSGSSVKEVIDFHKAITRTDEFLEPYEQSAHVWGGEILTNGVPTTYRHHLEDNAYMLVEFHTTAGAFIGGLACDRPQLTGRVGGPRYGEIIVYNRVLTARERTATRNYLMKKWFNRAPEPLPAAEDAPSVRLSGSGTFEKSSEGVLTVSDMGGFSGTLDVKAGTVRLTGEDAEVEPELVTEGLVYQADASQGVTTATDANGKEVVTEWKSALDDGWAAVPYNSTWCADYLTGADGLGGLPIVSMRIWQQCMRFTKDGELARLSGVKSVFWMIGSKFGGGFVLGGGGGTAVDNASCGWHRGLWRPDPEGRPNYYIGGESNVSPVAYGAMQSGALTADWWMNGGRIDPQKTGFSGTWDQMTMVTLDDTRTVDVDGFAFDGRMMKASGATNHDYGGHQQLAEVLLYDRRLSDEEREQVEAYLRCKWNQGMHAKAVGAEIVLAADAALDLDGGVQTVGRISGTGTIGNGAIAVDELVADGALSAWPTAEKCFIRPGQKVTIVNPPADAGDGAVVRIMRAGALEGRENLRSAVFSGTWPDTVKPRLCLKDGYLVLWYRPTGSRILVR